MPPVEVPGAGLRTVKLTEAVSEERLASRARASSLWMPFESFRVSMEYVQFPMPRAVVQFPPSIRTRTAASGKEPAVELPLVLIVPLTLEPFEG